MSTGDLVKRVYSNFRGVDFRGDEINLRRSPDSLNVWKDYRETESIRTRPGMALHTAFSEAVYGIFFYKGTMLVHSGKTLYKVSSAGVKSTLYTGLREGESNGFVYENIWYFKDGKHYLRYDGTTISEVEGFIPTTSIARKPAGGGSIYQDVNMLSDYRINTFLADGGSFDFLLDSKNIDKDYVPEVWVDDVKMEQFQSGPAGGVEQTYDVDYGAGIITFLGAAPDAPKTDGRDNITVKFKKTVQGYRENILKCRLLQVFDNRVFFSGNPEYPNMVWHCSLNDPTYVSDLDYYREGMDSAQVKGLVAGNNALWVFREPSEANTNVFYHTPTTDTDYGKIYPSSHSSVTTGCVGKAINFNDDIVFFSERGMEGISGDITTEQVVAHRSSLVDRKMIAEPEYKSMILEEWEGYLMVFIGNKVYLADSRTAFTNEDHIEYDWFWWTLPEAVTSAKTHEGTLYVGTKTGVYTLSDFEADVESYWATPLDKFKNPHKQKTTNKRGGVAEVSGKEISIFVKTNKDDDWELVNTYHEVDDAVVYRVKKKKFKDLQLKFYSPKRFALETATLECFVGGYLKNL